MSESVQKWLERNRPPRVKITYDVHTGGAIEKLELPFIVGIFADLSGSTPSPALKQRPMIPIDRDNFDEVLQSQHPRVALGQVRRTLAMEDGSIPTVDQMLTGEVVFGKLEDFEPVNVVKAIPALNRLYRARGHIRSLQSAAEANDGLAAALDALLDKGDEAKAARAKLQVLARPANTETSVAPAKLALLQLAGKLATSADDAARLVAAKTWHVKTLTKRKVDDSGDEDDIEATLDSVNAMVGLFGVGDEPDQILRAKEQLTALKGLDVSTMKTNDQRLNKVIKVFGLSKNDGQDMVDLAKALLQQMATVIPELDKPPTEAKQKAVAAAQAKVDQGNFAARVFLGLQELDEEAPVASAVDSANAQLQIQITHASANRWIATNALLQLRAALEKDTTDKADADTGATRVWDQLAAVQDLLALALRDNDQSASDAERLNLLAAIGQFSLQVLKPLDEAGASVRKTHAAQAIDQRVSDIDEALSIQLSLIMHSDSFRALEATWRGLHYLISRTETGKMLKLLVFDATMDELRQDKKAVDQDQSHLFKMIYEAEYGTLGGHPFSLLVGGYEVGRSAQDIQFLRQISGIAAAAHAPYITAASPSLFGLPSFGDLARPRDLDKIFEGADLAGWQEFRVTEDSRYVSLVLPHVLLRLPYGKDSWPASGLAYEEDVGETNSERFLWGNAAYMLAERITHAFSLYSWTAAIRGVEGGGLVEDLPLYSYDNGAGAKSLFCPTEVSITDRREKELNDLGFIALCHCKGKGQAAFFGGQTANLPKKYITTDANANAKLSALLPYMLAASRFAHYIKVMVRAKVGSFLTRGNVESYLNTWITQYVLLDENAMQEAKASFPLSQANVIVTDVPGEPGSYKAVVFLRPHFQLEDLSTSIRLVANLPTA